MKWQKKGLVYAPNGEYPWAKSHAHLPTAYLLNDSVIRVYFASLDANKYGRIGHVDLNAKNPAEIIASNNTPVLDLGELGAFDDCGVVPSSIIEKDGKLWCYYVGFQRTERTPYMLFSGLAIIDSITGKFERHSKTPILDRNATEPFLRSAPYVLYRNDQFHMWYVSAVSWVETNHKLHYINTIRYATSKDGISWITDSHICIKPNLPDEYSVGRPCVIINEQGYEMWFSARSHSQLYTMGYASSVDGIHWTRDDSKAGISKSSTGWDAEMICYPSIIKTYQSYYMFYNGNGCGASGFGYAVSEK